jgi:superoxide dismutase, Cu-Zn family
VRLSSARSPRRRARWLALAATGAVGLGCGGNPKPARVVPPVANTQLIDVQGRPAGTASVLDSKSGGLLVLKLRNLSPGLHGLHLHGTGACDPPNFGSAGPHYNPANKKHGSKNPQGPHAGDLPNVAARADGTVDTTIAFPAELVRAIGSGAAARALVVHAGPDDLMTDPSGNSGDRVACGVLQR